jgi:hypothetical protein
MIPNCIGLASRTFGRCAIRFNVGVFGRASFTDGLSGFFVGRGTASVPAAATDCGTGIREACATDSVCDSEVLYQIPKRVTHEVIHESAAI